MKTGRNDPCPCGSGRKYKHCCLPLEQADRGGVHRGPEVRRAAKGDVWQIDMVPLTAWITAEPDARPTAVLVVADGFVIHAETLARPSAEPEDVARTLADELRQAAVRLAKFPQVVLVRHEQLAPMIAAHLRASGREATVRVGDLSQLDQAARELNRAMSGGGDVPPAVPVASTVTWAAWGLPRQWCRELFEAAAALYGAAVWEHLWDSDLLEVSLPSGRGWWVLVLGKAGQEFGLSLFRDPEDPVRLHRCDGTDITGVLRGTALSLLFVPPKELPPPMRREVARAGWPVAGPKAFPLLLAFNTLGGGISRRDADDLVAAVRAVAAFGERHGEQLRDTYEETLFEHEATGATIRLGSTAEGRDLPQFEDIHPGNPEGPGADPAAALTDIEEDPDDALDRAMQTVVAFEQALRQQGLSEPTVQRHTDNAVSLVNFLVMYQGVPLAAMHEFDLRLFLYEWYPRKVVTTLTRARSLLTSLRRLFRFLEGEGLRFRWAAPLLRDRQTFERRWSSCPGHLWWDEGVAEWRSEEWAQLRARLMLHAETLGEGETWGQQMGPVEAILDRELQRRWLLWRDELLAQGVNDPAELLASLTRRQRAWESRPHPVHGGKTPVEAILAEREGTTKPPS